MNNLIRENETRVILYYYENKDLNNEVILDKEELLKAIPTINKSDISTINSVLSRSGLIETKQGSRKIKLKIPNIVHIYPQLNFTYLCNNFEQLKDLSYKEKQLLGYFIYITENQNKQFTTMQMLEKVINTSNNKLNQFLEQFKDEGILDYVKGEKGKRGFTFELKLDNPTISDNTIQNNNIDTNNGTIIQNQYNYCEGYKEMVELIKEQNNLIREQNKQIEGIKQSLHKIHDKFSSVEQCFDMLIDYINEVRSDVDNLYYIQNIQKVKNECAVTIEEIRKVLDR